MSVCRVEQNRSVNTVSNQGVADIVDKWVLMPNDVAAERWNQELSRFDGFVLNQMYEWGEHRRDFGWEPYRWVCNNSDGKIIAMAQGLLKRMPFRTGALWISGGPMGDPSAWNQSLRAAIARDTGLSGLYCRMFCTRTFSDIDASILREGGWRRVNYKLRSGLSMTLDLTADLTNIHNGLSSNWRRNLKRSDRYGLNIYRWKNPDIPTMLDIYTSMQDFKGLEEQYSEEEIKGIFRHLGKNIVLYRCDDANGTPIALRGCLIMDRFGWDLFAAASPKARKQYATYALFWKILEECKMHQIETYDLMGVDPENAEGVYNWKKGTGATLTKYLGEWEWGNNSAITWAVNLKLRRSR